MAAIVVTSPADVVNLALTRIGYKERVANLYDGSRAAKQALDIYGQTRQQLLRQNDWGFASCTAAGIVTKSAPSGGYVPPNVWSVAYPPIPWLYQYAYPGDCLKIRAVKPAPIFLPTMDPQPQLFATPNDPSAGVPGQKVLVCNIQNAILIYTRDVTDPNSWESDFIEAFAAELGRRLAPTLVGGEVAKLEAADAEQAKAIAEKEQG